VQSLEQLEEISRARGRSSVEITRADPSLVSWMQVGSWFNAGWRIRMLRHALTSHKWAPEAMFGRLLPVALKWKLRADTAFWAGVREEATLSEWRRLARTSYVVFAYHRLAGERRPGQQQLDISPKRFDAHMKFLSFLRYHPLTIEDIRRFHADPNVSLPNRSYLVTLDDGYGDNAEPLLRHLSHLPVLFVPTSALGGTAHWFNDVRLLTWDELISLEEAGVAIGSHGRSHRQFPDLTRNELIAEVAGSWDDLSTQLRQPVAAIAYPKGGHDVISLKAVSDYHYQLGFTSKPGRNGAGTQPLCLRRVGIWQGDSLGLFAWKVLTGEYFPGQTHTSGRGWFTAWQRARLRDPDVPDPS